jgi:GTP-binding protein
MSFKDEAKIKVVSGKGGDGCISFRREKYIPRGGPNGGDGGDGANVFLKINENLNSLNIFKGKKVFLGSHGKQGSSNNKKGSSAEDLYIEVPNGTLVYAQRTKEFIGEVNLEKSELLVAKGGKGGAGNARFKSSINQSPRKRTKGGESDERELFLELRLIADVGLIGLPNAGKSTLINCLTNAKSKVGSYEFTTLDPELGVIQDNYNKITIADLPGILKGASEGVGLGTKFLRHIFRTKILIHVLDASNGRKTAINSLKTVENELKSHELDFSKQDRWICISKTDISDKNEVRDLVSELQNNFPQAKIFPISSKENRGLCELKKFIFKLT